MVHAESHTCYHLEAAHLSEALPPFSHSMRESAARRILESNWIEVADKDMGIYTCRTFAKPDRYGGLRP